MKGLFFKETNHGKKRKDSRGRVLRKGEAFREKGR